MHQAHARGLICLSLATGLMSACSMAVHRAEPVEASVSIELPATERANEVLLRALGLVGTRYRYGGDDPDEGFDCSGLIAFVFQDAAGIDLPRSSAAIGALDAPHVGAEALAGGDIVLFAVRGRVNHVGIYVGDGRFVHSPKDGQSVRLDRLDAPYWREHYAGARRVL